MTNLKNKKIGVVGATGNQGGTILNHLLDNGFQVLAMARDIKDEKAQKLIERGIEVQQADLEEPSSLRAFLKGLDGAFLVLSFFEENWDQEVQQGKNFVDAAKATQLPHLIFSSVASAHRKTGVPHLESKWEVEQYIRAQNQPHTILGPVAFNYSMQAFKEPVKQGIVPYAFDEDTMIFQLDENNFARYVRMDLEDPAQWMGYRYDVASDCFPASSLASIFSEVTGKQVKYQKISWDEEIKAAGQEVVNLMHWIQKIGPDIYLPARKREYPWLTSFKEYLRQNGWENL